MTASNRINSHTDLNRIDETRGNNTVERSDLLVNERIIDRQPHTHHTNPSKTRRKTFNNMDLFCKMSKVPKITRNCNMYVFLKLLFNKNLLAGNHKKKLYFWSNLRSVFQIPQIGGLTSFATYDGDI